MKGIADTAFSVLSAPEDQHRKWAVRVASRVTEPPLTCEAVLAEAACHLFPLHTVITVDEADFRVYRRNKREAIPLLLPPRVM